MTQTPLALLRERNPNENDYLDVYLFGNQEPLQVSRRVQPGLSSGTTFSPRNWWDGQVPRDIGSRTNYIDAIYQAVDILPGPA